MQNERKAVTRLTLDLQLGDVQKSFGLTKGDVNRRLEFTLIDGGRPFEILSNWTAWLVGKKPDETELMLGCVVERGRVIYDLASGNQLSACEGYFPIWLTIFNEAGEEVYSPGVGVDVRPGPKTMNSDDQNTAIAELIAKGNRTQEEVEEIQARLPELAREVQLSTLTIQKNQWEGANPKQAFGNISGLYAANDTLSSRAVSILLLPVDNATRVESRSIGIEVTNVSPPDSIGIVTISFERKGDAPTMDLKYVVIAFTEPNETGEAFAVSAGFIGIGGSGAGDGGETDGITEQELSQAIYDHNVSDASHEDIRLFLSRLEERLGTLADSDDTTLDQLSEIVAYIKANKTLIDSVTTAKVNVVDIVDNLSTNVSNKPLSAAQGVKLNQSVVKLTTDYDGLKKSVDDLLYVPISIDEFKSSVTSAEKGSTVTETTLSWVLNKDPEAVSIDGVAVEPLESADYTLRDLAITANKKFTLSATDGKKTVTKDASINFYNGVYYGAATVPASYDSAFVIALGRSGKKVLRGSKLTSFTVTASAGEYIYYCLPVSMGACSFKVGGFDGGFDLVATLAYTNEYGHTEQYYIYRSANAGLGETNVEVK